MAWVCGVGDAPFSAEVILRKCSSQDTSSWLPSPDVSYRSLTTAWGVGRSYSARFTDEETEVQGGLIAGPKSERESQRAGAQSESHPLI